MSFLRTLISGVTYGGLRATALKTSASTCSSLIQTQSITSLCCSRLPNTSGSIFQPSNLLRHPGVLSQCPSRTYKAKGVLKLRCSGCYYEKRFGRLYVECTLKPRHKQMQTMPKDSLYRDDYSKGKWKKAIHWKWIQREGFYKKGDNEFTRIDWLKGRIGTEV